MSGRGQSTNSVSASLHISVNVQPLTERVHNTFHKKAGGGKKLNEIHPTRSESFHRNMRDVSSDPDNPKILQLEDVQEAANRIRGGIKRTSCTLVWGTGYDQHHRNEEQKERGVIAASAGNHAMGLAYHGQELGVPVTVVMPETAPFMKVGQCSTYGADVVIHGTHIGESKEFALRKVEEEGLLYINGFDHMDALAGTGTVALEIFEDVRNVDAVVVPVGGGGLIAGIACVVKHFKPDVMIIGVEAENCASMTKALEMGKPTFVKPSSTLADGLSSPMVGVNTFATAKDSIHKMVTVHEKDIAQAVLRLIEVEKAVVEGAGAVGLAAIMSGQLPELKGKCVVVPLTGGNIDTTVLGRTIDRGLACEGRLVQFSVTVSDRVGGFAELTSVFAKTGAIIKDTFYERAFMEIDTFDVRVRVLVETRDRNHANQVEKALRKHYNNVQVPSLDL